jgi:LmbE family N-acetylglucosaminyl deacetylase
LEVIGTAPIKIKRKIKILIMGQVKNTYRYIRLLIIRLLAVLLANKKENLPNSALIIAPHPDDEVFGCAGLMQQLLQQKKQVTVVILTGGEGAYNETLIDKKALAAERRKLTLEAVKILGLSSENIYFLDWEDGQIKNATNKINELECIIEHSQSDAIFVPNLIEGWPDHIYTSKIVQQLIKKQQKTMTLCYYCVWLWYSMPYSKITSINWTKSFLISMNKKEHERKLWAINAYIKPLTPFGKSYSGELPGLFVKANQWKKELYFQAVDLCGK